MATADQITDVAAILLFKNIRDGIQNGQIADLNAAKKEVDSAITQLNHRRIPDERACFNVELVAQLLLELGSMRDKVTKCEAQLASFANQAMLIKEDTAELVARADACTLLVQQQQKDNAKVLAAMEDSKSSTLALMPPPCPAPAPSPTDPVARAAPSRTALVSFPGGPRTITIHPPHSPNHQSVIRDEAGDIIIDFRRAKPLRREGAFRGSMEDINWHDLTRVRGRAPQSSSVRPPLPPVPRWSDHSQPSAGDLSTEAEIIARQRQLSTSFKTDSFKRILAPEDLAGTDPSSQSSSSSSSSSSTTTTPKGSKGSQGSSSGKQDDDDVFVTPLSTPPSPTAGRGKKRARGDDEDGGVLATNGRTAIDHQTVEEPTTPSPVNHEESHAPELEGPAKRQKVCLQTPSGSLLSSRSLITRTMSMFDVTQTF